MFKRTLTQWGKIRRSHAPPFSLLVPTRKPATVLRHITNWLCIRAKTVENLSRNWIFLKKYDTFYNLEFWIFFQSFALQNDTFPHERIVKDVDGGANEGVKFFRRLTSSRMTRNDLHLFSQCNLMPVDFSVSTFYRVKLLSRVAD